MKKLCFALFAVIVTALPVYASSVPEISKLPEVIPIQNADLNLTPNETAQVEKFNQGLVTALRKSDYDIENSAVTNEKILDQAVESCCRKHPDPLSSSIYDSAVEDSLFGNIMLDSDQASSQYAANTHAYKVNGNLTLTITPLDIYLDEIVVTPVNKSDVTTANAASWKYKKVATKRTLYKKLKDQALKTYSVHTGGEVKYNGKSAKHSSGYYAYTQQESYGSACTFSKIAKQSETCTGTSWHYKYLGKVSGKAKLTSPVSITVTFKEELLGCEAVIDKKGNVTKHYWPKLG